MFFRPLDATTTDQSVLLEPVFDGFFRDFMWEVGVTPLFVKQCTKDEGINYTILVDIDGGEISLAKYRAVSGKCSPSTYNAAECDDASFDYDIKCNITSEFEQRPPSGYRIENNHRGVFYLVHVNTTSLTPQPRKISAICTADDLVNANFTKNCQFSIGDTQYFRGINSDWLSVIQGMNYIAYNDTNPYNISLIKSHWNYPLVHDFWINSSDLNINYTTGDTFKQLDVFVKEFKTFVVDRYLTQKPVSIFFRVW